MGLQHHFPLLPGQQAIRMAWVLLLPLRLQGELAGVDYRSGTGNGLKIHLVAIDLNQHETAIGVEANCIQIA